jgi:hypothetical protein
MYLKSVKSASSWLLIITSHFEFIIQEGISVVKYSFFLILLERILDSRSKRSYKFHTKSKDEKRRIFLPETPVGNETVEVRSA